MYKLKDLLLCVHAVVRTLILKISRCHVADMSKYGSEVRSARAARLFSLIQPIKTGVVVALSSLVMVRHVFDEVAVT